MLSRLSVICWELGNEYEIYELGPHDYYLVVNGKLVTRPNGRVRLIARNEDVLEIARKVVRS